MTKIIFSKSDPLRYAIYRKYLKTCKCFENCTHCKHESNLINNEIYSITSDNNTINNEIYSIISNNNIINNEIYSIIRDNNIINNKNYSVLSDNINNEIYSTTSDNNYDNMNNKIYNVTDDNIKNNKSYDTINDSYKNKLPFRTKYNEELSTYNNDRFLFGGKAYKKKKYIKSTPNKFIFLKKKMFPPLPPGKKLDNLLIDTESIKYITFSSVAEIIIDIIANALTDFPDVSSNKIAKKDWMNMSNKQKMSNLVITDITAGVGGNTLTFAKYFKFVNAIEINTLRYNYLENNVRVYDYNNVKCYNMDLIDAVVKNDTIVQDLIFFDPPWGGSKYKLSENLRISIDKYTIEKICHKLLKKKHNKMIILKLPTNYDFTYFSQELSEYKVYKNVIEKMLIIIVKNY